MTIQTSAIYCGGSLQIPHPLELPEGAQVLLTVTGLVDDDPLAGVIGSCLGPESGDVADRHDEILLGP